jgi:ribose transport system ATP-binding protein
MIAAPATRPLDLSGPMTAPTESAAAAARIQRISKRFGPREILSDVSFTVERGQVHALLGATGAGKSSMVKILAGYYAWDQGAIEIGGVRAPPHADVAQMTALGVRVVHQDLGLFDGLSVLENVAAAGRGYARGWLGRVNWRSTGERVKAALSLVGLRLDLGLDVAALPIWQRVGVACARALYDGLEIVKLLILDEVTAALPPGEVMLILDIVRRLQARGAGVVYVTHRFEEVIEVADWVSVLRNGRMHESRAIAGVTSAYLVDSVAGHQISPSARPILKRDVGRPVLEMRSVSSPRVRNVSFALRAGEICGVAGRAGCGRSSLGRLAFGQERILAGEILLDGAPLHGGSTGDVIRRGVAYVPQDRQRAGVLPGASVRENVTIANLAKVSRFGVINGPRERRVASELVARYGVLPPDIDESIDNLSGGNQQKAILARWDLDPIRLFVLDEPTEGVDAGARQSIYRFIREAADSGAAVLLLSSSVEEIVEICDRALLMRDGELADEVGGDQMSVKSLEHLVMAGA